MRNSVAAGTGRPRAGRGAQREALSLDARRKLVLAMLRRDRAAARQHDRGRDADRDHRLERRAALLHLLLDAEQIARRAEPAAELVGADHLHAMVGEIDDAALGVAGHDDAGGDVGPGILLAIDDVRQVGEGDLLESGRLGGRMLALCGRGRGIRECGPARATPSMPTPSSRATAGCSRARSRGRGSGCRARARTAPRGWGPPGSSAPPR